MRINCHTHVFNVKSIFTEETVNILLSRLTRSRIPGFLNDAIIKALHDAIVGEEYVDRKIVMQRIMENLKVSDRFKTFIDGFETRELPLDVRLSLEGDVKGFQSEMMERFFEGLAGLIYKVDADAARTSIWDYLEFIYTALAPDIDSVTDRLMEQLDDDDGVIALMMDITTGDGNDDERFTRQTEGTSRQILRYPGRVFPFFAVNPLREDHFERMQVALEEQGFIGIKLYPSLGYRVDSDAMKKVLTYCNTHGVPIMQHCNRGGFYKDAAFIDNSNPAHWEALLEEFPNLTVCFGHFGGDENLTQPRIDPGSWSGKIVGMMSRYEGRVFADISYHTNGMDGGDKEKHYFANLKRLLNDPRSRDAVLWGSDFFLVRQRLRESSYWDYYERRLSKAHFKRIADKNAKRYLGIADSGAQGAAISRYLDFVAHHADSVEGRSPDWLLKGVKRAHPGLINTLTAFGNRWSGNNQAHIFTFRYLKSSQFSREQAETIRFAAAGGLPLRKLDYWHAGGDTQRREDLIRSLAEKIDTVLLRNHVGYEPGYDSRKAVRALIEMLRGGDHVLADLAETIDMTYRFQTENDL
jgi:predicted TIM-barrel fold metal-dependent hydrolase